MLTPLSLYPLYIKEPVFPARDGVWHTLSIEDMFFSANRTMIDNNPTMMGQYIVLNMENPPKDLDFGFMTQSFALDHETNYGPPTVRLDLGWVDTKAT